MDVLAALQRLPARQRAVVVLRYNEDLDDRTIADWLAMVTSTVRSNAFRGVAALRAAMDPALDTRSHEDGRP